MMPSPQQIAGCSLLRRLRLPATLSLAAILAFILLAPIPGHAADQALIESLRSGGYVLYVRHAATDWSQSDRRRETGWDSCDPAHMRQLSDAGRDIARRVGEAIRRLGIPVGEVVASEFCRTRETARLLALGPVTTSRHLVNASHAEHAGGTDALRERAHELLATPPSAGTNKVLVSHGNVFMLVSSRRPVEAGTAILRPDGQGGFDVVAHMAPEDWIRLAQAQ